MLQGAEVYLLDLDEAILTDAEGRFSRELAPGGYAITINVPEHYPFQALERLEPGETVKVEYYVEPGRRQRYHTVVWGSEGRAEVGRTTLEEAELYEVPGTLGDPMLVRGGWEPDSHLEAWVELPEGYVATGFGAGAAPEWDVKRFRVWGRPLNKDGSLGEEKEFRGGSDLKSGVEKQVRLEEGRVLTSAGLNCMLNDINGIRATSAKLSVTATGKGPK